MEFVKVLDFSDLPENSHRTADLKGKKIALFNYRGKITALGNACLHRGGSLGDGFLQIIEGEPFIACPWHGWQYNIVTGKAPAGFKDCQSTYAVKIENDSILVSEKPATPAFKADHDHDPIEDLRNLRYQTTPTSLNVLGISTTNLNPELPRASTSEHALEQALQHAKNDFGAETRMLKLRDLKFRHCEGYYSRHEQACTWPCSIAEMDSTDGMTQVYRDLVLWADVVILATPIRWGNASSLYYKMVERLNTIQNQITLQDRVLIKNKVASFIVTGGQDNIQQVVGQMNTFFTDIGFTFPPFNFVGWSRGWIQEDMENNVNLFKRSRYIKRSVRELVHNSVQLSRQLKQMDTSNMKTPKPSIRDSRDRNED